MSERPTPPGDVIRKELARRGWTQEILARILGRPLPTINEIIAGKRSVTPEMAVALAEAFDISAEELVALQARYRLSLVERDNADVAQRRRLYEMAPIKEMERRGWIDKTADVGGLRSELAKFFGKPTLHDEPKIQAATRKAGHVETLTASQRAWCFRAMQIARALDAKRFVKSRAEDIAAHVRELAAFPEEARRLPKVLGDYGIRFVVIEPLQGTRLDGAALWLDNSTPIIAVSIRYDRIDAFWYTVAHELAHIVYQDAMSVDADLVGDAQVPPLAKEDQERRADAYAAEMLLSQSKLDSFISRVGPLYSKDRINQFANRMKIHPGIIVGQLQYRGEIGYAANREMLPKIRKIVTDTALTDGWGKVIALH